MKSQTILETAALLKLELSPGQEAILRLLYGLPIVDGEQLRLALKATGRAELGVLRHYRNAHILAGRRSGKSTRLVALIAIHEALFAGHIVPEHEGGYLPVIGPVEEQARKTFKVILKLLQKFLPNTIVGQPRFSAGESEIELTSGVVIQVAAARANAVRGGSCVAVIIEEGCHFGREDKSAHPLSEIVGSLRPALLTNEVTGAKFVFVSSPWVKSGLMYENFRDREQTAEYTLCVSLPSRDLNPSLSETAMYIQRKLQGESWFRREFLSEFVDAAEGLIPADDVDAAVQRGRQSFPPEAGRVYVAGFDLSARGDDSAISICHRDSAGIVWLDFCQLWTRPVGENTIDPFQVLEQSCGVMKHYRVSRAFSDQVLQSVVEHTVRKHGILYNRTVTYGTGAAAIYRIVRELFVTRKVRIPDNPILIQQLKALEQQFIDGGGSAVAARRGKDDLAVSCCLSLFQAYQLGGGRIPWVEVLTIPAKGRERGGWRSGNGNPAPFGSSNFGELGGGGRSTIFGMDPEAGYQTTTINLIKD